ncbi:MAG: leucine--tRNA ligase [Candidatus Levybacteria bacterium]|nr:leucine--tRNA ligase [Candidatus Levybacteria bacterium]
MKKASALSAKDQVQGEDTKYFPQRIEQKWQEIWLKEKIYQPDLHSAKRPYYNLHMFPYPSAEGLHVGNVYAFTGADIHGRFKRMQGFDVFQPFGLDGFGIHSENYALKIGSHPMEQAKKSEKRFYDQVKSLGSGYDWSHILETYDTDYYRWTQWIFIELFKSGLAYRESVGVNFCPSCMTVLADEQVIDGQCERCGAEVEKKELKQWMFRITEYAEQLLEGLDKIDWTEKVKTAQRNWIGKSQGAKITFRVADTDNDLSVFTTRPDTLFGATFMVVSPEHPLVKEWMSNPGVSDYVAKAKIRALEKDLSDREKSGVFSGAYVINPINNQQMPVWIADYVLMSYGTGAIMAVPGHDQRDYEFARKYELPIIQVIQHESANITKEAYTGEGKLINSGEWNGLLAPKDKDKIIAYLQERGLATESTNYHLRDWLISRQRYWGPPIPMIYCEHCAKEGRSWFTSKEGVSSKYLVNRESLQAVQHQTLSTQMPGWYPDENLPIELPYIEDYKPIGASSENSEATSPLGRHPEFYTVNCPSCGKEAKRETDVSDTFLDSAWYFYRYTSTSDNDHAWDEGVGKLWLPPTIYTGGAEHSVLHLLYARFLTKVSHDLGLVDFDEPFPRFFAHGLIIKDGAKMSKSKGNVVVPDEYIKKFGADTLRTYLMFLGPFNMGGDFRDSGIEGMFRFMKRIWVLLSSQTIISKEVDSSAKSEMHKAIKGVTEDIEGFHYNTAIAKIMTYYNFLSEQKEISLTEAKVLLQLLAPFAPHITEELWHRLGEQGSIHTSVWPAFDQKFIESGDTVIAVQINGKLRGTFVLNDPQASQEEVERIAHEDFSVQKHLEGKTIKKAIYVPGKILNFVVAV